MPARRRKTSKKTNVKARAHSSKTTRLRKTSTAASRRRSKSASKTRPKVKSRKPSTKRQVKRAVPQKRAMSRPKPGRESREMTPSYDMVVEEIETTSSPEDHRQTDLWGLEIPKP